MFRRIAAISGILKWAEFCINEQGILKLINVPSESDHQQLENFKPEYLKPHFCQNIGKGKLLLKRILSILYISEQ